jgi:hypothetical protein
MDQSRQFCDANVDFDDVVNAVKRAGGKAEERVNQKRFWRCLLTFIVGYMCAVCHHFPGEWMHMLAASLIAFLSWLKTGCSQWRKRHG